MAMLSLGLFALSPLYGRGLGTLVFFTIAPILADLFAIVNKKTSAIVAEGKILMH
jgi:hypothetical protein